MGSNLTKESKYQVMTAGLLSSKASHVVKQRSRLIQGSSSGFCRVNGLSHPGWVFGGFFQVNLEKTRVIPFAFLEPSLAYHSIFNSIRILCL